MPSTPLVCCCSYVCAWLGGAAVLGTQNCCKKQSCAACLQELANASHTTGLLLRLLLCQAEQGGMQLEADTANLENEFLLQQVAGSEASALAKPASAFARRPHALRKIGAQTVRGAQGRGKGWGATGPGPPPCAVHHALAHRRALLGETAARRLNGQSLAALCCLRHARVSCCSK